MRFQALAPACLLLALACLPPAAAAPAGDAPEADVLTISGAIGPATGQYVERALQRAADRHARVVVLRLDTPGGLASSMRRIIEAILASPVPVAGYVAPDGARAASAGTYILYATHIAAMAPTTNLGAATPVPIMGSESAPDKKSAAQPQTAEDRKVLNDSVAYIRALAEKRGRNAGWAEKAVREAASLTAGAALKKHVIDLIAPSLPALLEAIDGRSVTTPQGAVTLHTRNLVIHQVAPDWRIKLLSVITDPTLAYLLFLAGIIGLILEATHPGIVFPGVVGAICLLLALYGFELLPINYAGVGLIVLGIGLMIAEAFVSSFGSLGIGGVAAFVGGSVILMDTHAPGFSISLSVIIGVSLAAGIGLALLIVFGLRSQRRPVVSGREWMIGRTARATAAFAGTGQVKFEGEIWQARSSAPVAAGQELEITGMRGLTLDVRPLVQHEEQT